VNGPRSSPLLLGRCLTIYRSLALAFWSYIPWWAPPKAYTMTAAEDLLRRRHGWSTGSWLPRTWGACYQRFRPACPERRFPAHVAELANGRPAVQRTIRTSPDGSFRCACFPSWPSIAPMNPRPGPSAAFPRLQLHVVHQGAGGDILQGQRVARLISAWELETPCPPPAVPGAQDVPLLAVHIVEQRNPRRAVGSYSMVATLAGTLQLVALEIDEPVAPLVSPPRWRAVTRRNYSDPPTSSGA